MNSPEFAMSEKKKGIFFYMEKVITEDEIQEQAESEKITTAAPKGVRITESSDGLFIGMTAEDEPKIEAVEPVDELKIVEIVPEIHEERPEPPPEKPKPKPVPTLRIKPKAPEPSEPEAPKKPKETKKKPPKVQKELEKGPRRRKGARKIREEELELEESELEAMFAVKAEEEDKEPLIEKVAKTAKIEEAEKVDVDAYKSSKPEEGKFGGMFGDMLKSALVTKKEEARESKAQSGRKKRKPPKDSKK